MWGAMVVPFSQLIGVGAIGPPQVRPLSLIFVDRKCLYLLETTPLTALLTMIWCLLCKTHFRITHLGVNSRKPSVQKPEWLQRASLHLEDRDNLLILMEDNSFNCCQVKGVFQSHSGLRLETCTLCADYQAGGYRNSWTLPRYTVSTCKKELTYS